MSWVSAAAIFFIIWWTVLFAVLPFGVRNAHEAKQAVDEGHEAGAPVSHGLVWKAAVTTVISAVIFAVFQYVVSRGLLQGLSFP
jgi:predicted secreted protein